MSDISRKALIEWCKGMRTTTDAISTRSDWARGFDRAMERTAEEVENGRFDIPSTESEGEATRLRTVLENIASSKTGFASTLKQMAAESLSPHREDEESL